MREDYDPRATVVLVSDREANAFMKFVELPYSRVIVDDVESCKNVRNLPDANFTWFITGCPERLNVNKKSFGGKLSHLKRAEIPIEFVTIRTPIEKVMKALGVKKPPIISVIKTIPCCLDEDKKRNVMENDNVAHSLITILNGEPINGIIKSQLEKSTSKEEKYYTEEARICRALGLNHHTESMLRKATEAIKNRSLFLKAVDAFDDEEEQCPICLAKIGEEPRSRVSTITKCCRKMFCGTCMARTLINKPICPLCRCNTVQFYVVVGDSLKFESKIEDDLLASHANYHPIRSTDDTVMSIVRRLSLQQTKVAIYSSSCLFIDDISLQMKMQNLYQRAAVFRLFDRRTIENGHYPPTDITDLVLVKVSDTDPHRDRLINHRLLLCPTPFIVHDVRV
jgi:hypothetical protein